jgi:hypothetical protein
MTVSPPGLNLDTVKNTVKTDGCQTVLSDRLGQRKSPKALISDDFRT